MKFYPLQTWQRKLWQYSSGWEDKDGFSAMPSDQRLTLMAVRDHSLLLRRTARLQPIWRAVNLSFFRIFECGLSLH